MRELPSEILSSIVSNLNINDKLHCIRVCKTWHNIITNSVLYEDLLLSETNQFFEAIAHFTSQPELSLQVQKLHIQDLAQQDIADQLPIIFPLVKYLYLNSTCEFAPKEVRRWVKLERIEVDYQSSVAVTVLQNPFQHLRNLEFSLSDASSKEDFLRGILNVPALQEMRIQCHDCIDIQDMETIHANAPNLRVLMVDAGYAHRSSSLKQQENSINVNNVHTATSLKTFEVTVGRGIRLSMHRWLEYFGKKYTLLEGVRLSGLYIQDEVYEPNIIKMLQNMPLLRSIDISLSPLTANILNSISSTTIDNISVTAQFNDLQALQTIMSCQSTKNIKSLSIVAMSSWGRTDEQLWNNSFFSTSSAFTKLVDLSITNLKCNSLFLITLFNSFFNLQSLKLENVTCDYECINFPLLSITTTTSIQHLYLAFYDDMATINHILNYMMKASPLLKTFQMVQLNNYSKFGAGLALDFREHRYLRSIIITTPPNYYYQFDHIPRKKGKFWDSFYKEASYKANYHCINMAWNEGVDVDLSKDYRMF